MPRKFQAGTFEGAPHYRWVKMFKGVRYRVTCAELGLPEDRWTKEASYQEANAWWKAKEAGLEGKAWHPQPLTAEQIGQAETVARAAERLMTEGQVEVYRAGLGVGDLGGLAKIAEATEAQIVLGVPGERTIGHQLARYLAGKKEKADKGVVMIGTYGVLYERLHAIFLPWAGERTPLEAITADWWERWYNHCAGMVAQRDADDEKGWAAEYAAGIFSNSKSFVRWLWEQRLIELPRTLDGKGHKFERPEPIKRRFTTEEVKTLLGKATGQLRLHLLLMLNCGMTQRDISELRQSQIVVKNGNGYIIRRRSKTERKKKTPKVRYLLWGETLKELLKWRSTDPTSTYALLNRDGERWVREAIREDGRKSKADGIRSNFKHLQRKTGITKSLKVFRKTSATRLNNKKEFERLVFLFLGHRAPDIARRNYAATMMKRLSKAIRWLGTTYGLE